MSAYPHKCQIANALNDLERCITLFAQLRSPYKLHRHVS